MNASLLEIRALQVRYSAGLRHGKAADGPAAVDELGMAIAEGEAFGLAGQSGSGKSTVARAVVGLLKPARGQILYRGRDISDPGVLREVRRRVQIVFQDPGRALSPRRTIGQTLREPLDHFGIEARQARRGRTVSVLETVGLDAVALDRYPHQFSSGQRQRIALARALVTDPELLVADEVVSALDVSVQAQVIDLLWRLRQERGIAMLFISHDLAVIRQLADTVGVMRAGRMVECGPAADILSRPRCDYTRALLEAARLS